MLLADFSHLFDSVDAEIEALVNTPYTHLFGTNHNTTSSVEKVQLHGIVAKLAASEDKLDHVIERLTQRKAKLAHAQREHLRFSSVVGRLPGDILFIIFEHVIPSHVSDAMGALSSNGCTLSLSVSRVCWSWRTAALDNPKLWNKILVTEKVVHCTSQYKELSRRCRTHPTYLFTHNVFTPHLKILDQGDVLENFRDTCRGIEMDYGGWTAIRWGELDGWLLRNLPRVRSLTVRGSDVDEVRTPTGRSIYAQLANLHIDIGWRLSEGGTFDFSRSWELGAHGLRCLVLSFATGTVCMDLVQLAANFPRLQEFHISSKFVRLLSPAPSQDDPSSPEGLTTLPHLRILRLTVSWDDQVERFLRSSVLPSLAHLTFFFPWDSTLTGGGEGPETRLLEACFARSRCPLKKINIASGRCEEWHTKWVNRLRDVYPDFRLVDDDSWADVNGLKRAWYE